MYVHSCFLWTLKLIDLTDILLGSGSSLETTRVTLCLHWHTTTLFLSKGTCCNDHCTSRPARWLRSRAQPSLGGWNWGTPLTYNTPSILSSSVEILSAPANCPSLVALQMYPPIQTVSISISNAIVISSHTQVTWQPSILSRMVCRLSAPRSWGCTPCGPPHLLTVHVSWRINPISSSFYEQLDYEFGRDGWAMCVRQGRFMADLRLLAIWWCQQALCWTWRTRWRWYIACGQVSSQVCLSCIDHLTPLTASLRYLLRCLFTRKMTINGLPPTPQSTHRHLMAISWIFALSDGHRSCILSQRHYCIHVSCIYDPHSYYYVLCQIIKTLLPSQVSIPTKMNRECAACEQRR